MIDPKTAIEALDGITLKGRALSAHQKKGIQRAVKDYFEHHQRLKRFGYEKARDSDTRKRALQRLSSKAKTVTEIIADCTDGYEASSRAQAIADGCPTGRPIVGDRKDNWWRICEDTLAWIPAPKPGQYEDFPVLLLIEQAQISAESSGQDKDDKDTLEDIIRGMKKAEKCRIEKEKKSDKKRISIDSKPPKKQPALKLLLVLSDIWQEVTVELPSRGKNKSAELKGDKTTFEQFALYIAAIPNSSGGEEITENMIREVCIYCKYREDDVRSINENYQRAISGEGSA